MGGVLARAGFFLRGPTSSSPGKEAGRGVRWWRFRGSVMLANARPGVPFLLLLLLLLAFVIFVFLLLFALSCGKLELRTDRDVFCVFSLFFS